MKKVSVFSIILQKISVDQISSNTSIHNAQQSKAKVHAMLIAPFLTIKSSNCTILGVINQSSVKSIIFLGKIRKLLMMRLLLSLCAHLANYVLLLIMMRK